jgi:hypothetical protein
MMSGDPDNLEQIAESDEATLGELSKSENAESYAEERREQEAADAPPADEGDKLIRDLREKHNLDDAKRASRYERRKFAMERIRAENENLRKQVEGRASTEADPTPGDRAPEIQTDTGVIENSLKLVGDKYGTEVFEAAFNAFANHVTSTGDQQLYNKVMSADDVGEELVRWHAQGGASQAPQQASDPYQAALEQGRQDVNFQAAIAEREAQIRVETAAQFRAQEFAKTVPDFHEALADVNGLDTVPAPMLDMIHRSEFGPAIAYMLAKDCWEGQGVLMQLAELDGNPIAQAQVVGRLEQLAQNQMNRSASPQRATKAPAPIKPITGGSGGPKDLHSLAQSTNIDGYISARRGNV